MRWINISYVVQVIQHNFNSSLLTVHCLYTIRTVICSSVPPFVLQMNHLILVVPRILGNVFVTVTMIIYQKFIYKTVLQSFSKKCLFLENFKTLQVSNSTRRSSLGEISLFPDKVAAKAMFILDLNHTFSVTTGSSPNQPGLES